MVSIASAHGKSSIIEQLSVIFVCEHMNSCQNCGKLNTPETHFCRFCGTRFAVQQVPRVQNPYDYSSPRPYAWQTDEFQTQNEARKTIPIDNAQQLTNQLNRTNQSYRPAPLTYQQAYPLSGPIHCENCGGQYMPRIERRISSAGWITFAILLIVFFPLFWIGLLIKEEVAVCQVCDSRIPKMLYR